LICPFCDIELSISQGLTETDGKRCHVDCKENWKKQWRKIKDLDDI